MNRHLMAMVAAIVLVVAACSGASDSGSATTSETETTVATAPAPQETETSVATTSGDQEESGERSAAKDATFRISFPIGSLTGGKVVATSDGTTRTLDIFYPGTVRDNLITFYTIWNKGRQWDG